MPVGADLERYAGRRRRSAEHLLHPPLARLNDDEPLRIPAGLSKPAKTHRERLGECGRFTSLRGCCKVGVVHLEPLGRELVAKVSHGRKKDGDPRFVRPDVGALFGDLRHPNAVAGTLKAVKCGAGAIELVAEDDHE